MLFRTRMQLKVAGIGVEVVGTPRTAMIRQVKEILHSETAEGYVSRLRPVKLKMHN